MAPKTNQNQAMVKIGIPSASQSKQRSEVIQEPYSNQIMNYNPIDYMATQYALAQPPQEPCSSQRFMLAQHFAAIPDKQMLPLTVQSPIIATLQSLPEMFHRDVITTSAQSHVQGQLQRKHEELQQLIMKQQEELQLVSEQLHLAQHGMLPVVSSAQLVEPLQAQQIETVDSNDHEMVLRLMKSSTIISNGQQEYFEQSLNQPICHLSELPSNATGTSCVNTEQLAQNHSSISSSDD